MQKSEKAVIIEGMKEIAGKSSIAVMTEFKGMTVEESTNLRVDLRKVGAEYHVIKNTLGRIAFENGKHDAVKGDFHDNTGVALGFDGRQDVTVLHSNRNSLCQQFAITPVNTREATRLI